MAKSQMSLSVTFIIFISVIILISITGFLVNRSNKNEVILNENFNREKYDLEFEQLKQDCNSKCQSINNLQDTESILQYCSEIKYFDYNQDNDLEDSFSYGLWDYCEKKLPCFTLTECYLEGQAIDGHYCRKIMADPDLRKQELFNKVANNYNGSFDFNGIGTCNLYTNSSSANKGPNWKIHFCYNLGLQNATKKCGSKRRKIPYCEDGTIEWTTNSKEAYVTTDSLIEIENGKTYNIITEGLWSCNPDAPNCLSVDGDGDPTWAGCQPHYSNAGIPYVPSIGAMLYFKNNSCTEIEIPNSIPPPPTITQCLPDATEMIGYGKNITFTDFWDGTLYSVYNDCDSWYSDNKGVLINKICQVFVGKNTCEKGVSIEKEKFIIKRSQDPEKFYYIPYNETADEFLTDEGEYTYLPDINEGNLADIDDYNNDSYYDLIAYSINSEILNIFLYEGDGHGCFEKKNIYTSPVSCGYDGTWESRDNVVGGRFNSDNYKDILFDIQKIGDDSCKGLLINDGLGNFIFQNIPNYETLVYTPSGRQRGISAIDFDKDGLDDLAILSYEFADETPMPLHILENIGSDFNNVFSTNTPASAGNLDVNDIDFDGDFDVLSGLDADGFAGHMWVLENKGGFSFEWHDVIPPVNSANPEHVAYSLSSYGYWVGGNDDHKFTGISRSFDFNEDGFEDSIVLYDSNSTHNKFKLQYLRNNKDYTLDYNFATDFDNPIFGFGAQGEIDLYPHLLPPRKKIEIKGCCNLTALALNPITSGCDNVVYDGISYWINGNTKLCKDHYYIDIMAIEKAIIFNASNIILDCNGAIIDGVDDQGYGIYNDLVGNNLSNGNFMNYQFSINLMSSSQNNIYNNNISNNQFGITLGISSSQNNIYNNNIFNNDKMGINLHTLSNNNNIFSNIINNNNHLGILISENSQNNLLNNNEIFENSKSGILLVDSENNVLINNVVKQNLENGILMDDSNYNNLSNNIANNNNNEGIRLFNSSNNILINNTANDNFLPGGSGSDGFSLNPDSNENTLIGNTAINNQRQGFLVSNSFDNVLINNTACNNKNPTGFDFRETGTLDSSNYENSIYDYSSPNDPGYFSKIDSCSPLAYDVLIVTIDSVVTQLGATLDDYKDALINDGYNPKVIRLDIDLDVQECDAGFSGSPVPVLSSTSEVMIPTCVDTFSSEFVIILGGHAQIEQTSELTTRCNDRNYNHFNTDDYFVDLDVPTDGYPDIPIGRIATTENNDINPIKNYIEKIAIPYHTVKKIDRDGQLRALLMRKDGINDPWTGPDSFIYDNLGSKCTDLTPSNLCWPTPIYYKDDIINSQYLFILTHGNHNNPQRFTNEMGHTEVYKSTTLPGYEKWENSVLLLEQCYGGKIDGRVQTSHSMIAQAFLLDKPPVIYLGGTRTQLGTFGSLGSPTCTRDPCTACLYDYFYDNKDTSNTIGEAFLKGKNDYLTGPYADCVGCKYRIGHQTLLYGDPTIKFD